MGSAAGPAAFILPGGRASLSSPAPVVRYVHELGTQVKLGYQGCITLPLLGFHGSTFQEISLSIRNLELFISFFKQSNKRNQFEFESRHVWLIRAIDERSGKNPS